MLRERHSAYGDVEKFISTIEDRPLEKPDQPQKSLGEIIFSSMRPKEDWQEASPEVKLEHEQGALYIFQKWLDKIATPFPTHGEYHWGAHLYISFYTYCKPGDEEKRGYQDWQEESANNKEVYNKAANSAVKALLLRTMTLQQDRINGNYSDRSLYARVPSVQDPEPEPRSLGHIAYSIRFEKDDFQNKPMKFQAKWEDAVQYLFYVWHQRMTKAFHVIKDYSWGAHLYIGIFSSRNDGYSIWDTEPVVNKESYNIAANTVTATLLRHAIALQQQRIDGQPSDESLFPA